MVTQDAVATGQEIQEVATAGPSRQVTERPARSVPGLRMLVLGIVLVLAGVALAVLSGHHGHGVAVALVTLAVLVFIASALVLAGLPPSCPAGPASCSCSAVTTAPSATLDCSG